MSESYSRPLPGSTTTHAPRKVKPWMIYAGGGALVLGVYFFVIRPRSSAATDATDTTDETGIDPSLGYADSSDYGSSLVGYTDPSTGTFIPIGSGNTVVAPTTNAAWVQQASAYLVQSGYNPIAVLNALGRYVSSHQSIAVSPNEMHIIQAAIGAEGYPPVKPPEPHLQPPSGQTKQTKQIRTVRAQTLHELADNHHMEIRAFVRLNPRLAARFLNTGNKIPKGTLITVYA